MRHLHRGPVTGPSPVAVASPELIRGNGHLLDDALFRFSPARPRCDADLLENVLCRLTERDASSPEACSSHTDWRSRQCGPRTRGRAEHRAVRCTSDTQLVSVPVQLGANLSVKALCACRRQRLLSRCLRCFRWLLLGRDVAPLLNSLTKLGPASAQPPAEAREPPTKHSELVLELCFGVSVRFPLEFALAVSATPPQSCPGGFASIGRHQLWLEASKSVLACFRQSPVHADVPTLGHIHWT